MRLSRTLPSWLWAQDEPGIDEFVFVQQEPEPLNLNEVRQLITYPPEAVDKGVDGTVVARVLVSAEGEYVRHSLVKSIAPALDAAVEAQLPNLRFAPAQQDGEPVAYWLNLPFPFRLIDEREENLQKKLAQLTDTLSINRDDYVLWQKRGVVYSDLGDYSDAIVDFTESISLNPKKNRRRKPRSYAYLFYAYYSRGIAYTQQEALDEALEDFTAAIEVAEEMKGEDSTVQATLTSVYQERGYVYALEGQYEAAKKDLRRVLKADDSLACEVYPILVDIGLEEDNAAELVYAYSGMIDCRPEDKNLYYSRGFYRSEAGDYPGAIRDMERVVAASKNFPLRVAAFNRIAYCHLQTEDIDAAVQALEQALELNAVNQLSHYYMGLALEAQAQPDRACTSMRKALYFGLEGPEGEAAIVFLNEKCGGWEEE